VARYRIQAAAALNHTRAGRPVLGSADPGAAAHSRSPPVVAHFHNLPAAAHYRIQAAEVLNHNQLPEAQTPEPAMHHRALRRAADRIPRRPTGFRLPADQVPTDRQGNRPVGFRGSHFPDQVPADHRAHPADRTGHLGMKRRVYYLDSVPRQAAHRTVAGQGVLLAALHQVAHLVAVRQAAVRDRVRPTGMTGLDDSYRDTP